ncbi:MAG: amidase [Anaerolineales bacterium]|nr:MAG: amidase [Anaerolineales bacterium]
MKTKPRPQTASEALLNRIRAFEELYTQREPRVHAFITEEARFQRLQREARALANKYKKPEKRPALFGLLLGIKDIFHVDGFPTQAGSHLPARALQGKESAAVGALKRAGALVAGKTVTTEFAYFTPGPTRNPHNTDHTPGGSSSGSAAAVAAGLVDLALGTQTIGSVIRPASFCGVVGYKPSHGRISAEGVIPLAPSLDHVGLFAQSVALIRSAADVLLADRQAASAAQPPSIAIPAGEYLAHASKEMLEHLDSVAERLRKAGYHVKRVNALNEFAPIVQRHRLILAAEAAQTHAAWYARYAHLYSPKLAELIKEGQSIRAAELEDALEAARGLRHSLGALMNIHGFQLWLAPSAVGAAPAGLASTGDPVMNLPWTQAGIPALGLPTGWSADGLPLGTQLIAAYGQDEQLLAWGAEIEAALAESK